VCEHRLEEAGLHNVPVGIEPPRRRRTPLTGGRARRSLFGIGAVDPITFTGAAALFGAVGLVACYAPARRASRIDATEALRHE